MRTLLARLGLTSWRPRRLIAAPAPHRTALCAFCGSQHPMRQLMLGYGPPVWVRMQCPEITRSS